MSEVKENEVIEEVTETEEPAVEEESIILPDGPEVEVDPTTEAEAVPVEEAPTQDIPPMDFGAMGGLGGLASIFGAMGGMMPPNAPAQEATPASAEEPLPDEAIVVGNVPESVLEPVTNLGRLNSEFLNYTLIKYGITGKYDVVKIPDDNMASRLYVRDLSRVEPVIYPFDTTGISVKGFAGLTVVYNLFNIIYLDGLKAMIVGFEEFENNLCLTAVSAIGSVTIPLTPDNNIVTLDANTEIRNKIMSKLS